MAKPTHTLFRVIEGKDGKDNFWLKIGTGDEFNLTNGTFSRRHWRGHARILRTRRNIRLFIPVRSFGVAPWGGPKVQIPMIHGSSSECSSPSTNESAHQNADRTTDQSHCGTGSSATCSTSFRPIRLSCPARTKYRRRNKRGKNSH